MTVINSIRPRIAPVVCNFGWYYGSIGTPQRLPEASFTVFGQTYPPGATTLTSSVTLPTASNIAVASTSSFEASGTIEFYAGLLPASRTTAKYVVIDATHIKCTGGTGTFGAGTPVFDPRFYVDPLPLNVTVVFDAIDNNNIGLPVTVVPPGVAIASYRWDFGNGGLGYGPFAATIYPYNIPPPNMQTTLTVVDSLGRTFSCAHTLDLLGSLIPGDGSPFVERQSNLSYR